MRAPFPLQWPEGRSRTPARDRKRGNFQRGLSTALDALYDELRQLKAVNVVVTSDLPTRLDGRPRADGGRVSDPGIAVWFVLDSRERSWCCDRWLTVEANVNAIALSIAAIRGLERWGGANVVERAFAGFAALPPGTVTPRSWREVLGSADSWGSTTSSADLLALVKSRHRALIRTAHPDAGGSHEAAAEINAALAAAERELQGA